MAHSKQALKRIRQNEKARQRNKSVRSGVKNAVKKALRAAGKDDAPAVQVQAEKQIDKAAKKGVIHKNTAARRKSRLAKAMKRAGAATAAT
jgi:small subunit ribosomal protein S20